MPKAQYKQLSRKQAQDEWTQHLSLGALGLGMWSWGGPSPRHSQGFYLFAANPRVVPGPDGIVECKQGRVCTWEGLDSRLYYSGGKQKIQSTGKTLELWRIVPPKEQFTMYLKLICLCNFGWRALFWNNFKFQNNCKNSTRHSHLLTILIKKHVLLYHAGSITFSWTCTPIQAHLCIHTHTFLSQCI